MQSRKKPNNPDPVQKGIEPPFLSRDSKSFPFKGEIDAGERSKTAFI